MLRNTLSILCLTFGALLAFATDYNVTGVITDSIGETEPYATIKIYAAANAAKPIVAEVTDENGAFSLPLPAAGDYSLSASAIGKCERTLPFSVSDQAPVANLGAIALSPSDFALHEITVSAQRPLVTREIDRVGYDVQADPDAETSPIIEILRKVPLVSVDPDGTILVNGSSDFKIYRNGRPNASFSNNANELFKSIPASSIKKIEVITDPGSREDAEGVSAILNIVTMQAVSMQGVSGTASLSGNNYMPYPANGSLFLTTQVKNFTISPYAGCFSRPSYVSENTSQSTTRYIESGNTSYSETSSKSSFYATYFGFDSSLEIDTLNLLNFEYSGNLFNIDNSSNSSMSMLAADASPIYRYGSSSWSKDHIFGQSAGVNYQRSTRRPDETITISYLYDYTRDKRPNSTEYLPILNFPVPYTGTNISSANSYYSHTAQLDWSRPYGKIHTLDLGGKYIYRRSHAITDNEYVGIGTESVDFIHSTTVASAYADYRASAGAWSFRAGLRYEYTRLKGYYIVGGNSEFGHDFSDLVPNLAVSYNINMANFLKLSFSKRINRPGIQTLDPSVNESPTTVSFGNPDLSSSDAYNINLNYTLTLPKLSVNINASHSFSNNGITQLQYAVDDILYSSYDNIGKTRSFYANGYVQWMIGSKSSLNLNASVNYNYYENPAPLQPKAVVNDGWSTRFYAQYVHRLPWNLRASASLSYWSGFITNAYSTYVADGSSRFNHSLSLQRSFLKEDRLTVNLTLSNPFGPYSTSSTARSFNNGIDSSIISARNHNFQASIRLSYRFGSLRAFVKKAKGITNDDLEDISPSTPD